MSEKVLKAILQLLALIAREDGVTEEEEQTVVRFLREEVSHQDTDTYLNLFRKYITLADEQPETDSLEDICSRINQEQSNNQKTIIVIRLMEMVIADGHVSVQENELIYKISKQLYFSDQITDLIKQFVLATTSTAVNSEHMLLIDDEQEKSSTPTKKIKIVHLDGFVAVLRITDFEIYFAKNIGKTDVLLNGIVMIKNHVYILSLGSVLKSQDNTPIYFSSILSQFRKPDGLSKLSFVATDLSYKFPNGNIGLRNVNLAAEGGQLIALMGGSGAGKSTLLNVLNGNDSPSTGSLKINGIDLHKNKAKVEGVIGYVPQDDLLVEELTVFNNLLFTAKLCFKNKDEKELIELSQSLLDALGLSKAAHLKVGSPLEKTISGGQRKRLNIGLELIREPSVLFVDEPTSGLSSRDSENIMDLLKELSLKGKLIFVVIHQPSEDIFKMFDELIILDVGGYQIYHGNPTEAIPYFRSLVQLVNVTSSANPEQIFNIIESKMIDENGHFTQKRKISPEEWHAHYLKNIVLKSVKEATNLPPKTLDIPNKIKQWVLFCQRDLMSKLSNKQYLLINFLEAPLLAFLLAFIIRYNGTTGSEYTLEENLNLPVFFFMSVIVALFMGLTISAEEIIRDRKILKREAFLNLSRLSYLLSKIVILFSISLGQTLSFVWISNWILEIQDMNISTWIILFSVSCFANILGLNISSAFKSAVTVYILIPLLIIPQLLLSGVVVNFDKLNTALTSQQKVPMIGEIMASRWAFEALAVSQFKDNAYAKITYEIDKEISQNEYASIYYIPKLQSHLDFVNIHYQEEDPEQVMEVEDRLTTLRNEIANVLKIIGADKFPKIDQLTLDSFSPTLMYEAEAFFEDLRIYYNNKAKNGRAKKDETLDPIPSDAQALLKSKSHNKAIASLVKNISAPERVIEVDNQLIQKIYPIFLEKRSPEHLMDFRTVFYAPSKYILGYHMDTLYFNLIIIWLMTLFLGLSLYFDWLRKLVS
tara:strand:+ start:1896 stop:4862 length:2967 start_codon:yes stop_codon:yes gene_type:complete